MIRADPAALLTGEGESMKRTPISHAASLVGMLTLASLAPSFLYGGPGWRLSGPETATVRSLAVDPTNANIVYLVSSGDVWKSTDAGAHWLASGKNLCGFDLAQIAVDPGQSTNLYVAGEDGVFCSTDGGATWHASDDSLNHRSVDTVAVDPTGHGIVYAGGYYGVLKSTDGGQTWVDQNGGADLGEVARILIRTFQSTMSPSR